jgi:hypothetical protein
MCLSARDAKNVVKVAQVIVPDNVKPYINAVDASVYVNENNHLEVDVPTAVTSATDLIKK